MTFVEQLFDVSKKCVLISGASSGFGAHFARMYGKAGTRKLGLPYWVVSH